MSCVTPHLYNTIAMYQYQQQQQLQQHPHHFLQARPFLLCHRLPAAVVSQYGALASSRPADPYQRLAEAQPPRNATKPLTPFSIADILQDGHDGSPSPPPRVVSGRHVRGGGADVGRRRSPDSTLGPRRPGSRRPDDGRPKTPHVVVAGGGRTISRPWDDSSERRTRRYSTGGEDEEEDDCDDIIDDDEEIEVDDVERRRLTTSGTTTSHQHAAAQSTTSVCPLDALLRMTSQPFDDPSSPGQPILLCIQQLTFLT